MESKFERKVQMHKYKRLLDSTYDDTKQHQLALSKDSYNPELFKEHVNFLSIVFEYTLHTVKGKDLVQSYITQKTPFNCGTNYSITTRAVKPVQMLNLN